MHKDELKERILKLKKEKNAVILCHNYQREEIYDVADYIGDSLDLSRRAAETKAGIIVFCGVDFMAQTAKILSPGKKVLLPSKLASCPMAGMVSPERLDELKKKHPDAAVVSYVNTHASTKAASDICCTSRNFIEVVNSLGNDEVIFVPDRHMADYLETRTGKKIIKWDGFCYVHSKITTEMINTAKTAHPLAEVIAHPECQLGVLRLADAIKSTQGMIAYAKQSTAKEFIIATEEGMCNRLRREMPGKRFYPAGGVCFNMKQIHLEDVCNSLLTEQHEVIIPEGIRLKAKKAVDNMLGVIVT